MTRLFNVGGRVSWNSEAGRVAGRIVRVHPEDAPYKGDVHPASSDDRQYEIKATKPIMPPCKTAECYGIFVIDDEPSPPQCSITLRAGQSGAMARRNGCRRFLTQEF